MILVHLMGEMSGLIFSFALNLEGNRYKTINIDLMFLREARLCEAEKLDKDACI